MSIRNIRVQFTSPGSTVAGTHPDESSVAVFSTVDEDGTVMTSPHQVLCSTLLREFRDSAPGLRDSFYDVSRIIAAGIEPLVDRFAWDSKLIVTGRPNTFDWSVWPSAETGVWALEIGSAIDGLTELVTGAVGGDWRAVRDEPDELGWFVHGEFGAFLTTGYVGNRDSGPTAQLIAALHRTVPAQMAILNDALASLDNEEPYPAYRRGLELAQQLNGA